MIRCIACGIALPPDARFCGECGTAQDSTHPDQFTRLSQPRLQAIIPADVDPAETLIKDKKTPVLPLAALPATPGEHIPLESGYLQQSLENDEVKNIALADLALLVEGGQVPASHIPAIQGTPQLSNIPAVQGTPQIPGNLPPSQAPSIAAPHYTPGNVSNLPAQAPGHFPPPHMPANIGPGSGYVAPPQPFPETPNYPPQQPGYHPGYTGPAAHAGKAVATKAAGSISLKLVIIIITIVAVAGGGSAAAAYVLTRPKPVISISSTYTFGKTPAGASGTTLHVTGKDFSDNSTITFLLDNAPAPGSPHPISDKNGNVSVDLPITDAWLVGQHTLNARDASNYTGAKGVQIEVVAQGEAHTPGPFGAPADDASFTLNLDEQGQFDDGAGPFTQTETLVVTGHPDPAGGSVCGLADNNQPQQENGSTFNNSTPFTESVATTCTGTYKSGKFTYTETITSDVVKLTNSDGSQNTCTLQGSHTLEQITGSSTSQNNFTGQIMYATISPDNFSCTLGSFSSYSFYYVGGSGTWTGTYTLS